MPRRLDRSDKGVLITREAARRIQRVVQSIEGGDQDIPPLPLRTAFEDPDPIRIGKVAADWLVGECATVDIWENFGAGCCLPDANDPATSVEGVLNLSFNVPAGSWVSITRTPSGKWLLVEAGLDQECQRTIGGEDVTKWPGWSANVVQILGHDASGCVRWFDVTDCNTGSGS